MFLLEPLSFECQKQFIFVLASSEESGLQQRNDQIDPTKILTVYKNSRRFEQKNAPPALDVNMSFCYGRRGRRGRSSCSEVSAAVGNLHAGAVNECKDGKRRRGGSAGIQSAVRSRKQIFANT